MSHSIAELRAALGGGHALARSLRSGLKTGTKLDDLLGPAGIPLGRITEIFGGLSSGKTSAALALLAACTQQQNFGAYVDWSGTFYAPTAAQAGVVMSSLLIVRPPNADAARRAVDALVRCGAFHVVVFDCGDASDALRTHHCARLAAQAEKAGTALVVLSQGNISAVAYFASLRLRAGAIAPLWQDGDGNRRLMGFLASIHVVKSKMSAPGRSADVRMVFPDVAKSWPLQAAAVEHQSSPLHDVQRRAGEAALEAVNA